MRCELTLFDTAGERKYLCAREVPRFLKAAQRAVLGDSARDLVAHAAHLQSSYESLAQYVEDFGTRSVRAKDRAQGHDGLGALKAAGAAVLRAVVVTIASCSGVWAGWELAGEDRRRGWSG